MLKFEMDGKYHPDGEPSNRTTVKSVLKKFSQDTTFHGVKFIGDDVSNFRRLLWTLFVLAGLTGVTLQIVDRVMYYQSRPVSVNVNINYNQTMQFPAVTVCNQNAFRATKAAQYRRYRLLEEMFQKTTEFNVSSLQKYDVTNLTIDRMYMEMTHTIDDMLLSCEWKKTACSADDFKVTLTDHGVCYTFSSHHGDMGVSSSGVDSGLRLTLNVEQYEYMAGPHDAAGVKVHLHDFRELPLVHELGIAIPTGSHAFVGVKFMAIRNLPKPHGECDNKPLMHTDFYTTEECYADCLVRLAADTCGCRDMFMPQVNGQPPVCTLEKYYKCLKGLQEKFQGVKKDICGCPVPCEFALFDPSVSYASISNMVLDKLLSSSQTQDLVTNLANAKEITAKMEYETFEEFKELTNQLFTTWNLLKDVMNAVPDYLHNQQNTTEQLYKKMKNIYLEKERLYRFQEYAVDKNFLRGREAMEERTLINVANAYGELGMLLSRKIRRLAAIEPSRSIERRLLYDLIMDVILTRWEVIKNARDNISLLVDAFLNGTAIFNYMFEEVDRSHNPYIIPKPLLNYSMNYNWYMQKYVPKLRDEDFDRFDTVFGMLVNITDEVYENSTLDEAALSYAHSRFDFSFRTFLFSKSVVYSQGIDMPLKILQERRSDLDSYWIEFDSHIGHIVQNTKELIDRSADINLTVGVELDALLAEILQYINQEDTGLLSIADHLLSQNTSSLKQSLENFFQEVKTRSQLINDAVGLLDKPTRKIWDKVLNDEDMYEYYNFNNNTEFLQNLTVVLEKWNEEYGYIKDNDVSAVVGLKDSRFFQALEAEIKFVDHFKSSIRIDGQFVKDNLLQLDVFFRQLSYEEIQQMKAYDEFALICDIGGAMGLFIGASALSIVEILDLIVMQLPGLRPKQKL